MAQIILVVSEFYALYQFSPLVVVRSIVPKIGVPKYCPHKIGTSGQSNYTTLRYARIYIHIKNKKKEEISVHCFSELQRNITYICMLCTFNLSKSYSFLLPIVKLAYTKTHHITSIRTLYFCTKTHNKLITLALGKYQISRVLPPCRCCFCIPNELNTECN